MLASLVGLVQVLGCAPPALGPSATPSAATPPAPASTLPPPPPAEFSFLAGDGRPSTPDLEQHFPRIEVYADGTNGAVERRTWLLDPGDVETLLATPLLFLPHFKETRPPQILKGYFDAAAAPHLQASRELFPRHLEGYRAFSDAERAGFGSLIEYQKFPPRRVEIVWLNKDQWFINDIFYHTEIQGLIEKKSPVLEPGLLRGTLTDLVRFSPVIQTGLDEGHRELKIPQPLREPDATALVLVLQLTPGSPGTDDWQYSLTFDGKIRESDTQLAHHRVAALLVALNSLDLATYRQQAPAAPADDRQSKILRGWKNGGVYTLEFDGGPIPAPVVAFFAAAKALMVAAEPPAGPSPPKPRPR